MRIAIKGRNEIKQLIKEKYIDFDKYNIISVNTFCFQNRRDVDEEEEMRELLKDNLDSCLFLKFDDITEDGLKRCKESSNPKMRCAEFRLFNDGDAKKILAFAQKTLNDKKNLYVHCTAGVSRSGAIGLFLNRYTNKILEDNQEDFQYNENLNFTRIIPNPHVSRILNNEILFLYEKPELEKR